MLELFLECDLKCQSRSSVFFFGDHLSFFLQKGNIIFITFIDIYRKSHISMYFLRNIIFYFMSIEKISFFLEKNTIFPDNKKSIVFQCNFPGKTNFSEHLEKWFFVQCFQPELQSYFHIIFPYQISTCIFLRKIIFHSLSKE